MKKTFGTLLPISLLSLQLISPINAFANQYDYSTDNSYSTSIEILNSDNNFQDRSSSLAVFFGGVVVAWVVDGVIEYTTGKPPASWISYGLERIEKYIKSEAKLTKRPVYVNECNLDPYRCQGNE